MSLELGPEATLGLSRRLFPYSLLTSLVLAGGSWPFAILARIPYSAVVPVGLVLLHVVFLWRLRKATRKAHVDPDGLVRFDYRLTAGAIEATHHKATTRQVWKNFSSFSEKNGLLRLASSRGPGMVVLSRELPKEAADFMRSQLDDHGVTLHRQGTKLRVLLGTLMIAIMALMAAAELSRPSERGLTCDRLPGAVIFAENATIYCD